jgi:hypothetical protein
MLAKSAIGAILALVCTASMALAQSRTVEDGLEEARQHGRAIKEDYLARGAELLDYGYNFNAITTLHNRGSAAVLVVACENHCTRMNLELSAEGLEPVRAQSEEGQHVLQFNVPANLVASQAQWRMFMLTRCRGGRGSCDAAWWLFALSPAPPLETRGGPRLLTDEEWNAATESPEGVRVPWVERFSDDQIVTLYPVGALRREVEGRVVLACVVIEGGVVRCRPESETPAGEGFAEAALRLSASMRAATTDSAGQPALGRRVRLPMRFALL